MNEWRPSSGIHWCMNPDGKKDANITKFFTSKWFFSYGPSWVTSSIECLLTWEHIYNDLGRAKCIWVGTHTHTHTHTHACAPASGRGTHYFEWVQSSHRSFPILVLALCTEMAQYGPSSPRRLVNLEHLRKRNNTWAEHTPPINMLTSRQGNLPRWSDGLHANV